MSLDAQISTENARRALPLKTLMQQHGDGPRDAGEKWNAFRCPVCGEAKKASVYKSRHKAHDVLRCHIPTCALSRETDEAGYLMIKGVSNSYKSAWEIWLKQAGVWKERVEGTQSIRPGGVPARKNKVLLPEKAETLKVGLDPSPQPSPVAQREREFNNLPENAESLPPADGLPLTTRYDDSMEARFQAAEPPVSASDPAPLTPEVTAPVPADAMAPAGMASQEREGTTNNQQPTTNIQCPARLGALREFYDLLIAA